MADRILLQESRQLIPRWHTSRKVLRLQSPFALGDHNVALGSPAEFSVEKSIAEWKENPCISTAIDLLVRLRHADSSKLPEYVEVTRFLESHAQSLSETARRYLTPELRYVDPELTYTTKSSDVHRIIGRLKKLVHEFPADPMTWMDLAFYYTIVGEVERANRAARIGGNLAPKHPYVARSYARYLVHVDQIEHALSVLERTDLQKYHPLISSAALAIGNAFNVGTSDVRNARKLAKEFHGNPAQISELLATLGTMETKAGSHKKARKLLDAALASPTENAIAQCSWLHHKLGIELPLLQPLLSSSAEAEATRLYVSRDFANCRRRLLDAFSFQPISDLPIVDAGYISIMGVGDPQFVLDVSDQRVPIAEMSFGELNNLIVAKLMVRDRAEAVGDIKALTRKVDRNNPGSLGTFFATTGMYFMVGGDTIEGCGLYENAIKLFEESNNERSLALAHLFYAKQLSSFDEQRAAAHREAASSLVEKNRIYEAYAELGIKG